MPFSETSKEQPRSLNLCYGWWYALVVLSSLSIGALLPRYTLKCQLEYAGGMFFRSMRCIHVDLVHGKKIDRLD